MDDRPRIRARAAGQGLHAGEGREVDRGAAGDGERAPADRLPDAGQGSAGLGDARGPARWVRDRGAGRERAAGAVGVAEPRGRVRAGADRGGVQGARRPADVGRLPRPAARGGGAADRGLARRPGRARGRAAAGGGAGAARGPAASAPHPGRARPDAGRDRLAPDGEGNDDDAGRSPAQRTRGDDARDAGGLEPVRRRTARTLAPDRGRRPRGRVLPRGLAQAGPRAAGAL